MSCRMMAPVSLCMAALTACGGPVVRQQGELRLTPLFGPVMSREVIGGRIDMGDQVTLLAGSTLVRIDLVMRRAAHVPIAVAAGDTCWGLARLDDGSVWSLKGHRMLIRIEPDGRVSREIALGEPHVGLFGAGDRLVLQQASATPMGPALSARIPAARRGEAWSDIRTRAFPGFGRAQSSALNMVACGASAAPQWPCWFPDEAAVSLVDAAGSTRRLTLSGLDAVAPEVLLAAENPARPIRDAFVDRRGRIWVLSTGVPPAGGSPPGGWILARYTAEGIADGQRRLDEPARLILRVDDERVVVLSGAGYVSEVKPW
jgi:hypothetical protein